MSGFNFLAKHPGGADPRALMPLGLDPWENLREACPGRQSTLCAIIVALWRDKAKNVHEMTAFEWETIFRFMGASQREIEAVRKQAR